MSTVVFVHGLWLHATSWTAWLEHFTASGHTAQAPGWPGDSPTVAEARANPDRAAGFGLDDVVRHYGHLVAGTSRPVVAVGHSSGGLVVQRLLARGGADAAVAISSAPVHGEALLPSSRSVAAPVAPCGRVSFRGSVTLTPHEFATGLGNTLPAEECADLYERWTVPAPGRILLEDAANLRAGSPTAIDVDVDRGPLLLITGGMDRAVPPAQARTVHELCSRNPRVVTDLIELSDRGHTLTVDHGWSEVADVALSWMKHNGL
ncbi:alpha/beta hydrolase [Promicromonospora sp. NPDC052451]|uniref:alpha/beta hydrolase n=1 Tax=Promicromonospora sp. NPDC052451 TaxID=3364407 RepID=UPI0037CC740A